MFGDKIIPEQSDKIDLNQLVSEADLLIGGVLIPGAVIPSSFVTKIKGLSAILGIVIGQK